jgi:hypothetical protein
VSDRQDGRRRIRWAHPDTIIAAVSTAILHRFGQAFRAEAVA